MVKTLRRLGATLAIFAFVVSAARTLFRWIARSEDDSNEVWMDDEEHEEAF